ncbi:hypothetical protein UFOVP299_48 [uncultured Caudovirales phage]|uniref:Uncharacterized protein n=1 Tax=uncultured Caudovirales phage TaxID=2100421 RepID=A0A6J5LTR6_9CAUD|nr:hypothetical protein UFOVP299_48 [uncultured Caudovirales phage]
MKAINSYSNKNYTVLMIKYNNETLGGFYSVELSFNDNIIKEKNGLCLDASIEYFLATVNQLKNL